jgi:hypothetical protein
VRYSPIILLKLSQVARRVDYYFFYSLGWRSDVRVAKGRESNNPLVKRKKPISSLQAIFGGITPSFRGGCRAITTPASQFTHPAGAPRRTSGGWSSLGGSQPPSKSPRSHQGANGATLREATGQPVVRRVARRGYNPLQENPPEASAGGNRATLRGRAQQPCDHIFYSVPWILSRSRSSKRIH